MREAFLNFPQQLIWEPKLENKDRLPRGANRFVVAGMGGSHLAADLLRMLDPSLRLTVHKDYGLPPLSTDELAESFVICSSYSGNTEETLDVYNAAAKLRISRGVAAVGGRLLEIAKRDAVPYVQLPDTGIQPRSALGFSVKALLKLMGKDEILRELVGFGRSLQVLRVEELEDRGRELAERLKGYIPIIYASERNYPIAYNWKIKFNETGKIPAFCNAFPELNHNEMTGFDINDTTKNLSERFIFILLEDSNDDHPRIQKRMEVLAKLLKSRNFKIEIQELEGVNIFHKIFSSLLVADWASFYLAQAYGVDPEQVPMVEQFKKLI